MPNPIEFTRRLQAGNSQRAGNQITVEYLSNMTRRLPPVTPTVSTGAHAIGDVLGGLLWFTDAAQLSGGSGIVMSVNIVDDSGSDVEMELWLFNAEPTAIADDAAFVPTEDDLHNLAGIVSTAEYEWRAAGTPSACHINRDLVTYDLVTGTTLCGYLVVREAITPAAADDITVILHVSRD